MRTYVSDENANPLRAAQLGPLNRRAVLAAGGVAGASAALLAVAGCATYSNSQGGAQNTTANAAPSGSGGAAASGSPDDGDSSDNAAGAPDAGASGTVVGPASGVPVGGGQIFADQSVVVTQPTAGTYKAFSSICTHQGCAVDSVSGGTINCPCHGSKFKIADGSVANGPAKKALPAKQVTNDGGQLRVS
jgi:Rieske Fe-S protein